MTERIDLDELDVESDDEPDSNRGDWFWRGDGDRDSEPEENWLERHTADAADDTAADDAAATDDGVDSGVAESADADGEEPGDADGEEPGDATAEEPAGAADGVATDAGSDRDALPGVPGSGSDGPAGIPVEGGGAGAGSAPQGVGVEGTTEDESTTADGASAAGGAGDVGGSEEASGVDGPTPRPTGDDGGEVWDDGGAEPEGTQTGSVASGPHGGGVDDMTMALTYEAAKRLDDPRFAVIDAKAWTDWMGIVGDVPSYVINKFQREHELDVDFFSDASSGPVERLRDIDEHSMFYAERMVVVGVDGEADIAAAADWEFVHVEDAAEKADWTLSDSAD